MKENELDSVWTYNANTSHFSLVFSPFNISMWLNNGFHCKMSLNKTSIMLTGLCLSWGGGQWPANLILY